MGVESSGLESGCQLYQLCSLGQVTCLLWASGFKAAKWAGSANPKVFDSIHLWVSGKSSV